MEMSGNHAGKGNKMLHFAMYLLLAAGLALGVYGVIDAVRNFGGRYE